MSVYTPYLNFDEADIPLALLPTQAAIDERMETQRINYLRDIITLRAERDVAEKVCAPCVFKCRNCMFFAPSLLSLHSVTPDHTQDV